MHLGTKHLSLLGLLLAFSVVLNVLCGIIETSTLFLLSAASFFVGIAFRETNKLLGVAFYLASVFLSFILAPNKIYCITYAAISIYIVLIELLRGKIVDCSKEGSINSRRFQLIGIKCILFNIIFLPILIFFPKLIIAKELNTFLTIAFFLGGQIIFIIYDKAYEYFMVHYWGKFRRNFFR